MTSRSRTLRAAPLLAGVLLMVAGVSVAEASPAPRTVLLVHGYEGSTTSFDQMQASLLAQGIPSIEVVLPGQDNVANANAIKTLITSRGLGTVDIVAHSMGGLSGRWYAKFLGGSTGASPIVAHYISLGTPQYGVYAACLLPTTDGGQMCPWNSFLSKLNKGDDTRGVTSYSTIYSTTDGLVPTSSSRLDGGACFVQDSGVTHDGLLTDATVFSQIVTALGETCPGTFK
jgi:triacylglycerol lipase